MSSAGAVYLEWSALKPDLYMLVELTQAVMDVIVLVTLYYMACCGEKVILTSQVYLST